LVEAAEAQAVVVVVDDAHWLDAVSAEALLFVARRLQSDRVAMVFGAREGDVRRFDAPGLTEMTFGGLDAVAAGALLAERTDGDVSREVREAIVARTGGNPLALVEIPTVLSGPLLQGVSPLAAVLPSTQRTEEQAVMSTPAHYRALHDEIAQLRTALTQAQEVTGLGDTPLIVVTAGKDAQEGGLPLQNSMARLSTNSVHRILPDASHASLIEDQHDSAASVAAITDVVHAVRSGRPLDVS
jgi:hypothetical protein